MFSDPEYDLLNHPDSPILEEDNFDEWEEYEDEDATGD